MDQRALAAVRFVLDRFGIQTEEDEKAGIVGPAVSLRAAAGRGVFPVSTSHYGWLGARFVPESEAARWVGVALTVAGVAIAIWARWHLGANWSGVLNLKEGHELIRSGPYRNIRHPIYTGILLALLGTAVALGEVRGLLAVAIAWLSFYTKARREESFLTQEFGERFAEHSRHTGMFLPPFS